MTADRSLENQTPYLSAAHFPMGSPCRVQPTNSSERIRWKLFVEKVNATPQMATHVLPIAQSFATIATTATTLPRKHADAMTKAVCTPGDSDCVCVGCCSLPTPFLALRAKISDPHGASRDQIPCAARQITHLRQPPTHIRPFHSTTYPTNGPSASKAG